MKKISLVVFLIAILIPVYSYAQDAQYVREMEEALSLHEEAQNFNDEMGAIKAFELISKKYPEEWHPHFWASYIFTQAAMLEGRVDDFPDDRSAKELVEESWEQYVKAEAKLKNPNNVLLSEFHLLNGFINHFRAQYSIDSESEKNKFNQIRDEEYKTAAKLNSSNPNLLILLTLPKTSSADTTSSTYKDIYLALNLIKYAEDMMNKVSSRANSTYWAMDFIPFWKNRASGNLYEALKE